MFQNLKNKIITETGQDPIAVATPSFRNVKNTRARSISSQNSSSIDELSRIEEKESEIISLKLELAEARSLIQTLEDEKKFLQKSIKVGQVQKEILYDETDKIQNVQHQEIAKLRSMLLFREQESLDQLNKSKNDQLAIDHLKAEIARIKTIEPIYENVKDELENLRRMSQLEMNQLITKLSAKEEENRHLTTRLEVSEQSRTLFTSSDSENEKIKLLLQERKVLENRLEEAHLHLYDIKSSWTSQNLKLENQLQRLSRQVAEETAEKRKAFEVKEKLMEKIKQHELELKKAKDELHERDNKIKQMSEEIDELNSSLREIRLENEEEIEFLRSKVAYQESELNLAKDRHQELKSSLEAEAEGKKDLQDQLTLIKSQSENLKLLINEKMIEIDQKNSLALELRQEIEKLEADVIDKTKAIKILNQRLLDVKKTLQEEIKNNNSGSSGSMSCNAPAILIPTDVDTSYQSGDISKKIYEMDEVKFSYLKHVILKFLTSHDLEAKHLIRAVSTLLYLSLEEEKLLTDTLEYKRSWFGTKPDVSFL